jgi:hypothetical protein
MSTSTWNGFWLSKRGFLCRCVTKKNHPSCSHSSHLTISTAVPVSNWRFGRQHLGWIDDGVLPADIEIDAASHAVDRHSVLTTLLLWREMSRMISERGRPLPARKHLLPAVVATWNRGKGPLDVYSRFQKSTKSNHANRGPIVGAIWLRLIMTTVYNAIIRSA